MCHCTCLKFFFVKRAGYFHEACLLLGSPPFPLLLIVSLIVCPVPPVECDGCWGLGRASARVASRVGSKVL